MSDTPKDEIPTVPPTTAKLPPERRHDHLPIGERPGDSIGPYRLLSVLGEGGFGVVFLAERREPFVQRVALKVIKPGMDTKAVVARFEQERQALAVMDHPNVAKVLDGGVTPSGRPYFVMEHVQGEPLTAYCDRQRLTLRERLEIFVPVCEAVQHAHMKGIIHRDLKPSNILISVKDGHPIPKVIDFGVAKAISHTLTEKTIFTDQGVLIGTPEYMSPEQAEMGGTDIDTRSDVYSLGVILYELLTGALPFDPKTLRSAGFAEIRRIIREVEPPRPSTRLSTADNPTGAAIARARHAERDRIATELRRELEWIPLKALRKDRTRRYASAESLGADISRYLAGQALEAAPESRAYLVRKFVTRNRGPVLTAGMVAVALVAGFGTALWQAREVAIQRDTARVQARRADENAAAEKARAEELKLVSDFQSQMLGGIDTTQAGIDLMADMRERFSAALEKAGVPEAERATHADAFGAGLARVNATDAAAAVIDRTILRPAIESIGKQLRDQPVVAAQLRHALADLYRTIAFYDAAYPLQVGALETRKLVLGEEHPDTLTSIHNMGALLHVQGKLAEAEPYLREALEKRRRVLGEEHPETLEAIATMGYLLRAQGKVAEAEPYHREALEKRRRVLGEEHPETLEAINDMGRLHDAGGNWVEAHAHFHEALEKSRRVLGADHPTTLYLVNNVGLASRYLGRLADAEATLREAVELSIRVRGENHTETLTAVTNLAAALYERGKVVEAEVYFRDVLERRRRVLGEEHPDTILSMGYVARILHDQGKLAEAEAFSREALEKNRRVLGEAHDRTLLSINNVARTLETDGKLTEAEAYLREAMETSRRALGEEHMDTPLYIHNLGALLRSQGRLGEAEPYLCEALEKRRRVLKEEHPETLTSINSVGSLLRDQGKFAEAEPYLREALEKRLRVLGDEHPDTLISISDLGTLLHAQGKHQATIDLLAPAEPAARTALTGQRAPGLANLLTTLARARIALGYEAARFKLAESDLLEAHPIYIAAKNRSPTQKDTLDCVQGLVDLYFAWNAVEPGEGYDLKAAEWKAKLDAAARQPSP
jgi:serine/threonine protein kinase/Tfp pilus assembly protein PilF